MAMGDWGRGGGNDFSACALGRARVRMRPHGRFLGAGDFEVLNLGTWEVVQRIRYQVAYPVLLP